MIKNTGQSGSVFLSDNQSSRLVCVHDHKKSSVSQGESELFSIRPDNNKTLFVTGTQEYTIAPQNYQTAWVYHFIFDGTEIIPTDARPLIEIGKKAPLSIAFTGTILTEREKRQLTESLTSGLDSSKSSFYPLLPESSNTSERTAFYSLFISLVTEVVPAQAPINREIFRSDFSLSLFHNGKLIQSSDVKRITELNRELLLQAASNLLKDSSWYSLLFPEVVI